MLNGGAGIEAVAIQMFLSGSDINVLGSYSSILVIWLLPRLVIVIY